MKEKEAFLSVPQVAERLKVHRNTVLYWIKIGVLRAGKKNAFVPRPQNSIPLSEVLRLERSNEKHG